MGGGLRLDHVRVDVSDVDVAERFYRDALELSTVVRYKLPNGVILQMGPDGNPPGVELWAEEGLIPAPSRTEHLAFEVDDVPAQVERVRSLGYHIDREPHRIGDETCAFIRDPDGHLIEFNDFKRRLGNG